MTAVLLFVLLFTFLSFVLGVFVGKFIARADFMMTACNDYHSGDGWC
jgi:uncharacterized protein YneF (UPF0154 family)